MRDFLGRRINVGDHIVYPTRQGSFIWMNKAEVIDVSDGKLKAKKRGVRRAVTLRNISNVVVLVKER